MRRRSTHDDGQASGAEVLLARSCLLRGLPRRSTTNLDEAITKRRFVAAHSEIREPEFAPQRDTT